MDDPKHPTPSTGLVPDEEQEINPDRLTDDTPDHFDTPMDDENVENELPEEGRLSRRYRVRARPRG